MRALQRGVELPTGVGSTPPWSLRLYDISDGGVHASLNNKGNLSFRCGGGFSVNLGQKTEPVLRNAAMLLAQLATLSKRSSIPGLDACGTRSWADGPRPNLTPKDGDKVTLTVPGVQSFPLTVQVSKLIAILRRAPDILAVYAYKFASAAPAAAPSAAPHPTNGAHATTVAPPSPLGKRPREEDGDARDQLTVNGGTLPAVATSFAFRGKQYTVVQHKPHTKYPVVAKGPFGGGPYKFTLENVRTGK